MSKAVVASLLSILALAACGERSGPVAPEKRGKAVSASEAVGREPDAGASNDTAPAVPDPEKEARAREPLIEPSRDLGGVLPLKHGVFVSGGIACGDPPNAALRRYDGKGLSGAHTHACEIKVLAKQGASYEIEQSCIDAGRGPAPRSTERATVDIQDNLTFTFKRGGAGDTFRYCAASILPPALRNW